MQEKEEGIEPFLVPCTTSKTINRKFFSTPYSNAKEKEKHLRAFLHSVFPFQNESFLASKKHLIVLLPFFRRDFYC